MALSVGSLCAGYEGLGLGLGMVLDTETAWVSEVDPSACAVLDARYPGVPNLGDLTALDWSEVPPVDVLTAGYPCQPFSTAGRRQGANDARHLWPFIADAVGVLRPRLVVLENVSGHLSMGAAAVLGDLARLGYDARWTVVRASDVGACHRRARLFIVAYPSGSCGDTRGRGAGPADDRGHAAPHAHQAGPQGAQPAPRRDVPDWGRGAAIADSECSTGRASEVSRERPSQTQSGGASSVSSGRDPVSWGAYGPAIDRHAAAIGRPAPNPVDGRGRLNPVFVEWMMMLPGGWVTDIVTSRAKALKCLGNGVVPPQAAYALRLLLERSPVPLPCLA